MNLFNLNRPKLKNVLKNPFCKKRIYYISVSMGDFNMTGRWDAEGTVYFKNGNTKGEQKFKGKHIDDVLSQINDFLDQFKA